MTDTTQNTTSLKNEGQLYTVSMLEPGDAGLFDKQLGELAHVQLTLLMQVGQLSMNELARKASSPKEDAGHSPTKAELKMANAALRALRSKGFVDDRQNLFSITKTGQDAPERYPDQFSKLFVQRELLEISGDVEKPVKSGWGALRHAISRRRG